jgi:ketosteroid isomerase-like protein
MAGRLTTDELAQLISEGGPFSPGSAVDAEQLIQLVTDLLRANSHPDYVTVMVSESVRRDYPGAAGFKEAWSDWMSPYESFRLEFDRVIRADDKLVFLVRQIAKPRDSAVEFEAQGASVWLLQDGEIREAAFYLDWRAGLEAAGIDPDCHLGPG